MKLDLKIKKTKTKSRHATKRSKFAAISLPTLRANRRAINAVLSNLILIAAVLAVGFSVLIWSQYQSAKYQTEYSTEVNDNIERIQEKIVFQYVVKEVDGNISAYLLNCGIQDVDVRQVYVNGHNCSAAFNLYPIGAATSLSPNAQAKISIAASGIVPVESQYTVKIITERGSDFVGLS